MVKFNVTRGNLSKNGLLKRKLKAQDGRVKFLQDTWRLFKTTIIKAQMKNVYKRLGKV